MTHIEITKHDVANFWSRVDKNGPVHPTLGACWVWKSAPPGAYGVFCRRGSPRPAHRFIFEMKTRRQLPRGSIVLHDCDNRSCVNPAHLTLGGQSQNIRDMVKRGRWRGGRRDGSQTAMLQAGHMLAAWLEAACASPTTARPARGRTARAAA